MPNDSEKISYEEYVDWYEGSFLVNLESGKSERWHEIVTRDGRQMLEDSAFWQQLQTGLRDWDVAFRAEHGDSPLLVLTQQPKQIETKTFNSTLNKAFRWNVLENDDWRDPPRKGPFSSLEITDRDPEDVRLWFGPHNWLVDFPDIFRVRLISSYFDGVKYLAQEIKQLAEKTTPMAPELKMKASHDGYHAAHVLVYHHLDTFPYDSMDLTSIPIRLEIQVTTTIQTSIIDLLHSVYEDWRLNGAPPNWEWDQDNPAFAVNYLGSTLHYLEGMIVMARDQRRKE